MKTARKMAGFFIVEILVVLLIIGILVAALMPNLTTYVQRAQYVDNLSVAAAIKPAVEGCLMQNPSTANWTSCTPGLTGTFGIPANQTAGNMGSFVSQITVTNGIITVTSTPKFGPTGLTSYTYSLTPSLQTTSGTITWTPGGTCVNAGLC